MSLRPLYGNLLLWAARGKKSVTRNHLNYCVICAEFTDVAAGSKPMNMCFESLKGGGGAVEECMDIGRK
jgi:hypothetical protein